MRRLASFVVLSLIATGLVVATTPSPAAAAWVGKNGFVLFSAVSKTGSIQVWRTGDNGLVDVTGTDATKAIKKHANYDPAYSPEQGAHVTFVSAARIGTKRLGPGDIWLMSPFPDIPDNQLTNLTHNSPADDQDPAFDYTGGHVVYSSAPTKGAAADIWKVTWTGRLNEDLTPSTVADDIEPAWSSREHIIAFVSNRVDPAGTTTSPAYGIWTIDSGDGTILKQLTTDGRRPNWSPNGQQIVFVRGGDIWVMNSDGSSQKRLAAHKGKAEYANPAFTPDGKKIVFQVGAGDVPARGTSLRTMTASGKQLKPLEPQKQFTGQADPEIRPTCTVLPKKVGGKWVITGTAKADLICFEKFDTTINAGGGDDSIYGGAGNNIVDAGPGNDIVLGGPGNDQLMGGDGNDYLEADAGTNTMDGGPGFDQCNGGPQDTFVNCEITRGDRHQQR